MQLSHWREAYASLFAHHVCCCLSSASPTLPPCACHCPTPSPLSCHPPPLPPQVDSLYQDGGFNWGGTFIRVWHGVVEGLKTTFLEPENGHFWRGCIYGRNDDHVR